MKRHLNIRWGFYLTGLLTTGALWLTPPAIADAQTPVPAKTQTAPQHRHRAAKKPLPPPLPSGPRGPVPQVPLDSLPAVAPEITFQNGLLTIVAANSTLGDVLRAVQKQTSADIDVPSNANERVAVHLGPAPPRDVVAELLNGSHFNYVLLGSQENTDALVRVVLVAKTGPDNLPATQANATPAPVTAKPADDSAENTFDEAADQAATEADETPPTEPGVKTPQEMLQEMQQRQLQMQQQQQQQQQNNEGQTPPAYPPPGGLGMPQRPPGQPQQPPQDQ